MTPRQARRILREMPRADRRATFAGIYKYTVDGGLTFYTIDRHGIPTLVDDVLKSIAAKMDAEFLELASGGVPAEIATTYADVRRAMGVPIGLLGVIGTDVST